MAVLRLRYGISEDSSNSQQYPITKEELQEVINGNGLK
jgi:hypothetical protein